MKKLDPAPSQNQPARASRKFLICLEVEAASLAQVLDQSGVNEAETPIVAAIETNRLATVPAELQGWVTRNIPGEIIRTIRRKFIVLSTEGAARCFSQSARSALRSSRLGYGSAAENAFGIIDFGRISEPDFKEQFTNLQAQGRKPNRMSTGAQVSSHDGLFECSRCGSWTSAGDFAPAFICDRCWVPRNRRPNEVSNRVAISLSTPRGIITVWRPPAL